MGNFITFYHRSALVPYSHCLFNFSLSYSYVTIEVIMLEHYRQVSLQCEQSRVHYARENKRVNY